jgi:hypothetical protein
MPIGFCSRDPIGYLAGHSLSQYTSSNPCTGLDPTGYLTLALDTDHWGNRSKCWWSELSKLIARCKKSKEGQVQVDPDDLWCIIKKKKGYWHWGWACPEYEYYKKGCMGVTGCFLGWEAHGAICQSDCYLTLQEALSHQEKKDCGCKKAEVFAYTWRGGNQNEPCPGGTPEVGPDGRIKCYNQPDGTQGDCPYQSRFDFGYYYGGCIFHAEDTFGNPANCALVSNPELFHNYGGQPHWQTIYCVICEGDDPTKRPSAK